METVQSSCIHRSVYRDLPLTQLQELPFNARKRFPQSSLEELAQSIRSQAVVAPLLVQNSKAKRVKRKS